ncbi:alpha/beta hydrolase fold-domain-containing protein [Gilbertella persicaria]|uniref:alpha/beta hydrolase fold-domain-containing protein n=1 Tax=Gilbertella persicaria TaxID=101096 RepID=UPI00222108F2|nr:alpha/beta hydrolase fold-domain-containing protein [Gilbertella persicaria]KAI8062768.1 alpha/beta hydrolase fold-domain-containing protein [Gilbertella persicaria]
MPPLSERPRIHPVYQEACSYSKEYIYPLFEKNVTKSLEEQRKFIIGLRAQNDKPFVKTKLKDVLRSKQQMDKMNTTIFRPLGTEEQVLPVTLLIHGGGWLMGNTNSYSKLAIDLCITSHSAVVFVEYSLSPEVKFPIALEECFSVVSWILQYGRSIHLNSDRLVVTGDSAGGNMAAALPIMAKDRGLPHAIQAQVLLYPVLSPQVGMYPSHALFSDGAYGLGKHHLDLLHKFYFPQPVTTPYAAPLLATADQLKGLPTALILTCEADILRDEGEAYAAQLLTAGVDTVGIRMMGVIHGYLVDDYPDLPSYITSLHLICDFIKSVQTI